MMILFTALLGVLLAVFGVVCMRPVAQFLGATPEMLDDCVRYGRIVIAFTGAFMLQNVFQSFLIAAEKPKLGLAATVAAGVTNMALDALFVAGFRWGIAGAAIATGLSQCVGGLFPLAYFLRPNTSRLRLVKTRLEMCIRDSDCRDDEQCQNDDGDDLGQDRFGFGCFGSHEAHSFNKKCVMIFHHDAHKILMFAHDSSPRKNRDSPQDLFLRPRYRRCGNGAGSSAASPFRHPVPAGYASYSCQPQPLS